MREIIEVGAMPCEEDCVQVTPDKPYFDEQKEECKRYLQLMRKVFPWAEEHQVYFKLVRNSHEYGDYYEAGISYDPKDELQVKIALFIEANSPTYWSEDEVIPMPDFKLEEQGVA